MSRLNFAGLSLEQGRDQQECGSHKCERDEQSRRLPIREVLYEQLDPDQDQDRVDQPAIAGRERNDSLVAR